MTLFDKNFSHIKKSFKPMMYYPSTTIGLQSHDTPTIYSILIKLKSKSYIPKSMSLEKFIQKLTENEVLILETICVNDVFYTRFSRDKKVNFLQLFYSIRTNGFFSMSTALNMQNLSTYKEENIFISKELTPKHESKVVLFQDNIDSAFKKKYRITKKIGKHKNHNLILLDPKHTDNYEVIVVNKMRVSSINRALVEMIINIQYFRSIENLLEIFKPLANKIVPNKVFLVLKRMNLIYPYYNSVGFFLELLGVEEKELTDFKANISPLRFYFEKRKERYDFNAQWNVYY